MTDKLTFEWPHWKEQTNWHCKERLLSFLRGFAPRDCKIYVEVNGKRHEWKHKDVPLAHKRTAALDRLLAAQKEDNIAALEHLAKCRQLRGGKSV